MEGKIGDVSPNPPLLWCRGYARGRAKTEVALRDGLPVIGTVVCHDYWYCFWGI